MIIRPYAWLTPPSYRGTQNVSDLPEVAKNFLNWRYIEADEETGLMVIF